ncbi:hypothetical protein [Segnochrobactrum spirostomi]|uniref:Uncharacterized protein n=1 Tax=Segnochrobactrum spirostomi TaxID=2608987 RepID=A0A6A7Y5E0_9HYPH|nr:hypothetical protein [Segnochrobactrum spirostomi]MQT14404.1 hypothetical protein [Segnochrobactrum spirostomi]
MRWQDLASPLAQAGATVLGTIIGGPLGASVGGLVGQALGTALGVPATPEAIGTALATGGDDAAQRVQAVETARADEWAALAEQGARLMQTLADKEVSEGWFAWAWRPALSWLVTAIIAQTFLVAPWARAIAHFDVSAPYDQVMGIAAIWLTIYGGGHTLKAVLGPRLGAAK